MSHINFKLKHDVPDDKKPIVELLFKSWIDTECNNEVIYTETFINNSTKLDILTADFYRSEDAVKLKLRGIPSEFKNFLEIVH